ncbi:MAG: signal peptide peptidase SppA [Planctomycetota bacterium]
MNRSMAASLATAVIGVAAAGGGALDAIAQSAAAKADSNGKAATKAEAGSEKVRLAYIQVSGALPESPGQMTLFGDLGVDLRKMIARLDKAAEDDSVAGVVLRIDSVAGYGKLNELRAAVKRVQVKGNKVYAAVESAMGQQYLLAAACDEIVMPESGMLVIPGIRGAYGFYKDMLAKIGVEADIMHMGESKGAGEPYTRTSFSEPVKKNLTAMVDDLFDQMVANVASDRGLKVEEVRTAIDRGLYTASAAHDAGLIDHVCYPDQFRTQLGEQYKADKLVYVKNYGKKKIDTDFSGPMGMMKMFQTIFGGDSRKRASKDPKLAIVYAVGPIMPGKSVNDILAGQIMGSTTIVEALDKANDDESVKAIVMRVDSPGGSALASDLIWRATRRIEKPIVVSMGNVAGSGGYYISMGADRIFAEPGTITGSIGVVSGKMSLKGLYDKIGMGIETISRGQNSGIFSTSQKFTESERQAMMSLMEDIYEQFTSKAAAGRGMDLDKLKSLAGGKVYTGRVAKRLGLVDEVGTLQDAIAAAKRLAGLKVDKKVEVKLLPEPVNPFEELLGGGSESEREVRQLGQLGDVVRLAPELKRPLRQALQFRKALGEPAIFMMPFWIEVE